MTIILFLIDTSGSMNQKCHSGAKPTLLDITKETVERFLKIRQREPVSRGDRYMLLTFDEVPHNIKAGWKEQHNVFINELKNLTANSMTTMSTALKNSFDYLNVNRMQTGIDTYGQGRCPYYLESAIILLITDGSRYCNHLNIQDELIIPSSHVPGFEFTNEAYRWDQRLFSVVLRLTGTYKSDRENAISIVPCDNSPLNNLCEVTGGRSFCVTSKQDINWSLEYICSRMHNGVMVRFEKFGPDPPNNITNNSDKENTNDNRSLSTMFKDNNQQSTDWHNTRNLIFVRPSQKGYSVGNWPIPESYWPDVSLLSLQPRSAHPVIRFTCNANEPAVIENLPFDKYELDSSPLTYYILSRKQPNVAWQVFVANSQKNSELGQPFGYLKASTNLTCVNLFVLPYNYPTLLPLLEELFKTFMMKPSREWRQQFDAYLKLMPVYYSTPLRRALQRMNVPPTLSLVPETLDQYTAVTLNNIIKKQKTLAKIEFEKLTQTMNQQKPVQIDWPRITSNQTSIFSNRKLVQELFCSNPVLKRTFSQRPLEFQDFQGFIVRFKERANTETKQTFYRNPFDIPRNDLLNQASKLREMFFSHKPVSLQLKQFEDDQQFNLPVSQMGNYQEYLKKKAPPLREIEAQPARQHMFGNPFKLDKKNLVMIDEADIELVNGQNGSSERASQGSQTRGIKRSLSVDSFGALSKQKQRKPGPLPKDFVYHKRQSVSRPSTPILSSNFLNGNSSNNCNQSNSNQQNFQSSDFFASYHSINNNSTLSMSLNGNNNIPLSKSPSLSFSQENNFLKTNPTSNLRFLASSVDSQNSHMIINNSIDQKIQFNNKLSKQPQFLHSKPISNGIKGNSQIKPSLMNGLIHQQQFQSEPNNYVGISRTLNKNQKEKINFVLNLVRLKDLDKLIPLLIEDRDTQFGDFLLQQAVCLAHRLSNTHCIQAMIKNFGQSKVFEMISPFNNLIISTKSTTTSPNIFMMNNVTQINHHGNS